MKRKENFMRALFLTLMTIMSASSEARMNMGTITIEVGETKQVTSEPSTNYTVAGSWSKTGESISITSRLDRSCKIWGVKEGTATLEWSGLINSTWEDMYWTVNVVGTGGGGGGTGGGGNSGTPDTGFSDSWTSSGNYSISWFDKSKSELHISTAKELAGLAYLVNNGYSDFSGKTVKLDADIDLDGKNWPTIGDGKNYYYLGSFDGQNHTISGIYIVSQDNEQEYYGFFSYLSASSVKNIRLQGKASIENRTPRTTGYNHETYTSYGDSYIGGLVGYAKEVIFENCKVEMDVICKRDHPEGRIRLGGIIGRFYSTSMRSDVVMKYCSHSGKLHAGEWNGKSNNPVVGGLVGYAADNDYIEYCENISSEIYCSSKNGQCYMNVGGIIGDGNLQISYSRNIVENITINNNSNYVDVKICGIGETWPVTNCYSVVKKCQITSNYKTTFGGIALSNLSHVASFSNSDVTKSSNITLQEGYHGSTTYTSEQMRGSEFLDELNVYPQINLGKTIWVADEDGYPCISSYWRDINSSVEMIYADRNQGFGKGENAIFTLSGQRLSVPQKGINIIGGKKFIVR